jgi:HAD superfamily hydrolase (TIGR01509 family)
LLRKCSGREVPALGSLDAVVFDMDGVLLDSSPIHAAAYLEALGSYSIPAFQYSRLAGLRTKDGIRRVLSENGIALAEQEIDSISAAKSKIALERMVRENPIVRGARAVLEALSRRRKLALASSGSAASVNAFLDCNGLRSFFECVLHSDDIANAKPSPEIFLTAFHRLGFAARKCLVVEDAVAGIQAAKAAGGVACGIPTTCAVNDLEQAGADFIIDRLEDLL